MKRGTAWEREQEYQALRRFIRLGDSSDGGSMAGRMAQAVESELTPRQRELVRLYYMEQMTMADIAEQKGVAVSTVSRTIKRGRERLKRALKYGGRALLSAAED